MTEIDYRIRPARPADIAALRAMQARSMRALGRAFYEPTAIAAMLEQIGTMDDAAVAEGHFLLAEDRGGIVGSGGWSRLVPGYEAMVGGNALDLGDATIRSVFVDPAAARRGIGSAIMARAERDAARHGIRRLGLTATLSGVPLYRRLGYRPVAEVAVDLGGGRRFGGLKMEKLLEPADVRAA
jgi:GNAT superfamily N-acetyltransferase